MLYSLIILYETNVLNLINQRLDTIYQIKSKRATVLFFTPFYTSKHSPQKKYCANKRFLVTSNLRYMHGVLNVDEIKN
jgi:hypothetical protein